MKPVVAMYSTTRYDLQEVAWNYDGTVIPQSRQSPSVGLFGTGSSAPPQAEHPTRRGKKRVADLVLLRPEPGSTVAIFGDGSLVAFGLDEAAVADLRVRLAEFEDIAAFNPVPGPDTILTYRYTTVDTLPALGYDRPEGVTSSYVDEGDLGAFVLDDTEPDALLPFVFALAYHAKVEGLNTMLLPLAERVRGWREDIRRTGELPFTVQQARMNKSALLRLATRQSRIGARPSLFSDTRYAQHRVVFSALCDHFEVHDRSDVLRRRIETVADTMQYLGNQSHNRSGYRLEYIICVLLAVEIILHLAH